MTPTTEKDMSNEDNQKLDQLISMLVEDKKGKRESEGVTIFGLPIAQTVIGAILIGSIFYVSSTIQGLVVKSELTSQQMTSMSLDFTRQINGLTLEVDKLANKLETKAADRYTARDHESYSLLIDARIEDVVEKVSEVMGRLNSLKSEYQSDKSRQWDLMRDMQRNIEKNMDDETEDK